MRKSYLITQGKKFLNCIYCMVLIIVLVNNNSFAKVWEIETNDDWINAIRASLSAGDTVMFVTDGGSYMTPTSGYFPSKELVFMAAPQDLLINKDLLNV